MLRPGGAIATAFALALFFVSAVPASAAATPTITVSPAAGIAGKSVSVVGDGYPPNSPLTLEWSTVVARWVVSGNPSQVTGLSATPAERTLAPVQTDSLGSFSAVLVAPQDFGGQHVLQVMAPNGTALAGRALFTLEPSFQFSPPSGPAGTPVTVTATGLGYGLYSTSYHLYWDNSYVGYFTAVSGGGSTNFTFYASGSPGVHFLDIYQGYPGPGYLNPQQGPPSSETQSNFPPYIPFHGKFTVTAGGVAGVQSLPASLGVPSLLLLAAGAVACGAFVAESRRGSDGRRGVARTALVLVIILMVAIAGVAAFVLYSASSPQQVAFTPAATAVRPPIAVPQSNATSGPRISVSPDIASVGQTVTVKGEGFSPNAQLPLTWTTRKGNNLHGYQLVAEPLRNVTAASDGSFSFTMAAPPDLGGLHFVSASNLTEKSNGTLFLQRTASVNATEGPAGTTVAITMSGVGWTYDTNIAALDYDNSYIGYGCGFNSGGNVTFYLTMTGAPGVHTIDIYPSIWWGPSSPGAQLAAEYRYPLLTPQDHPELMPSFHFTFLITATGQHSRSSGVVLPSTLFPGLAVLAVCGASPSRSPGAVWRSAREESGRP